MRVKRYVVDSMPDALQQIRSELGKDAVILNTKEVRLGGFLGLFSKKKIEVIAATDAANAPSSKRTPAPTPIATSIGSSVNKMTMTIPAASSKPLVAPAEPAIAVAEPPAAYVPKVAQPAVNHFAAAIAAAASREEYVPDSLHVKPGSVDATKSDDIMEEIRQVKEMMRKLSLQQSSVSNQPESLRRIEERLLGQEVSPTIVQQLVYGEEHESASYDPDMSVREAEDQVRDRLMSFFAERTSAGIRKDTRIVHIVGPTGVGKTTTIAKLAAEQVLKYNRKVGFITSDTYRIAAVEQLRTYANILNVPVEVVFSPLELAKAYKQLEDRDIIFMDTAGRNFRNEMYVSELNSLLASSGSSETYLVLSLTMKYRDMKAIAENFNKFKLDKVLFTKMDETDSYGSVVNLLHEYPLQLSYVTNGQNVPDDIALANTDKIVDLLMEDPLDD